MAIGFFLRELPLLETRFTVGPPVDATEQNLQPEEPSVRLVSKLGNARRTVADFHVLEVRMLAANLKDCVAKFAWCP
jgi:hypothetical protein